MRSSKIKTMSLTALCTSFIIVCSWLTIPFAVPFTMQTFAIFVILLSFGGKIGFSSVLLYLTLGAIGVPVFSSFGAGFGTLFGPSGGFLWGFLIITLVYLCFERFFAKKPFLRLLALLLGMVLCYLLGAVCFSLYSGNESLGFLSAVAVCVVPYIIPDALKMLLAFSVYKRLKTLVKA